MTLVVLVVCFLVGAVGVRPLARAGRGVSTRLVERMELIASLLFPLLIAAVLGLLLLVYPYVHALITASAGGILFLGIAIAALHHHRSAWRVLLHSLAAGLVLVIGANELLLACGSSRWNPWHSPAAYAWVGGRRAQPALLLSMRDANPAVRIEATRMMGELGRDRPPQFVSQFLAQWQPKNAFRGPATPASLELLRELQQGGDVSVRLAVVGVLGTHEDAQSEAQLATLLRDPSTEVRTQVLSYLSSRENARYVPEMLAAVASLDRDDKPTTRSTSTTSNHAYVMSRDAFIPEVRAALRSPDFGIRQAAVHVLGSHTNNLLESDLVLLTRDPEPEIRLLAVERLSSLSFQARAGGVDSWDKIESGEVMQYSTGTRVLVDHEAVAEALTPAVRDADPRVRKAAMKGMCQLLKPPYRGEGVPETQPDADQNAIPVDTRRYVPLLIGALRNPDDSVREMAADALTAQPDRRAIPGLLKLVQEADQHLQRAAARALVSLHDPSVIPQLKAIDVDPRTRNTIDPRTARYLANLRDPAAVARYKAMLATRVPRCWVCWALYHLDAPGKMAHLFPDESPRE